ncbi:MAG TPA: MBL fold metallo-hydrolase [Lacibacter sp.]|nr:MBL fold metallo-hydrolase [Lacibacter sp.]HMO89485.1 MBL fold metallo-hydrolase [Lacibacter sp.]HMP87531.1 MBL fold metallo-hydrolase [Lacibacter sp.]
MKIAFHGAARSVTGSKHLLTLSNGKKILLDCGLFQGMGKETDSLNRHWGFDPASVNYVILSHAHIDHCGLLPRLFAEGYAGRIFCTPATSQLAAILLEDSAGIQEDEVKYENKRRAGSGLPYLKPLYTVEDARGVAGRFATMDYGNWFRIDEDIEVLFTDAGHIIGSAAVHLRIRDNGRTRCITFSGDIGRYRDLILRSPQEFPQADTIILESTYGNSLHDNTVSTPDQLLEWIEKACLKKKGKLIIPAFSVGRTQELLYDLNQLELERRLPELDYYVDSPLSLEATQVVKSYPQYFNRRIQRVMETDNDPFQFKGLRFIRKAEESKLLNFKNGPFVVISASGMADAGRVKHHIFNAIENSRNTILMTGYCEPNSLGARLLEGRREVGIFGVSKEVHAEVGQIRSMSAHGDYEDMSQWLSCQDPRQVEQLFLVHGEYNVQQPFRDRLIRKGFQQVIIPERHFETGI